MALYLRNGSEYEGKSFHSRIVLILLPILMYSKKLVLTQYNSTYSSIGILLLIGSVIMIIIFGIYIAPFSFHKMFTSAAHCHSLSHSPQNLSGRA